MSFRKASLVANVRLIPIEHLETDMTGLKPEAASPQTPRAVGAKRNLSYPQQPGLPPASPSHPSGVRKLLLRLVMTLVGSAGLVVPQAPGADIASGQLPINCGKPDAFVPYASNHPIDKPNHEIKRLIVGIHSSGFDAIKCQRALGMAAGKVPGATGTTLILTPQFFGVDSIKQRIPDGMLAWRVLPYYGSSLACIGPRKEELVLSAHDVLNQILSTVVDHERFPNLKTVVVCGHSAGGQMAQRYAITSKFRPPRGVEIRFVASGASSYAYLDSGRPRQGKPVNFGPLEGELLKKFPAYNKWPYGLDDRYRAFRRAQSDYLRDRYATRRVLYLCGSKDNDPNDRSMSTAYGAMLGGRNRLERMKLFYLHLIDVYGEDIRKTHTTGVASGVNHNGFDAYASPMGLKFLFDHSRTDSDKNGKPDWQEWLADN